MKCCQIWMFMDLVEEYSAILSVRLCVISVLVPPRCFINAKCNVADLLIPLSFAARCFMLLIYFFNSSSFCLFKLNWFIWQCLGRVLYFALRGSSYRGVFCCWKVFFCYFFSFSLVPYVLKENQQLFCGCY